MSWKPAKTIDITLLERLWKSQEPAAMAAQFGMLYGLLLLVLIDTIYGG